ncbi:Rid family hydrolase [Allokutzneria albata]|uniref:Rid family hydrolase n=1 Tax=Allokutzneria albata TaxID=211114 RepID=UPI003908A019
MGRHRDLGGRGRPSARRGPDDEVVAQRRRAVTRRTAGSGSPLEPQIGFSRAARVGQHLAVAGTAPISDDGATTAPGDVFAQTVRCLDIAERALREVGASIEDVARTQPVGGGGPRARRAVHRHPSGVHLRRGLAVHRPGMVRRDRDRRDHTTGNGRDSMSSSGADSRHAS